MTDTIDSRLKNLGISIPEAAAPAANYVPFAQSGSLLLTSGQLPSKAASWCTLARSETS